MTRDEIISGLEQAARASEDDARSCEAVVREHRPEYERLVHVPPTEATKEGHERALELYPHVIPNEHNAKRWHKEAALFRAAAEALR